MTMTSNCDVTNSTLALKNSVALKIFTVLNIPFTFRIFEQLGLALNSLYWIYIFIIQDFWAKLALALKTEFAGQTALIRYNWPTYATGWNPTHEIFLRTPLDMLNILKAEVDVRGGRSLIFWIHVSSDSETFCSASAPPPQIMEKLKSDSVLTPLNCVDSSAYSKAIC